MNNQPTNRAAATAAGRGRGRNADPGRGRGRNSYNSNSTGRGGGRGGRQTPTTTAGGRTAQNTTAAGRSASREDRKSLRREKQAASVAKKATEEDRYFRQCQQEARKKKPASNNNAKDSTDQIREAELFGKQIVKGINFEKYNDIHVEVKLPSANAKAKEGQKEVVPLMEHFANLKELLVSPQLQTNIQLMKYSHPTPIQKHAIPMAMAGEDLMCCAQTGSGKTCAFLLPVVAQMVKQQNNMSNNSSNSEPTNHNFDKNHLEPARPKCVVLAPTRELASQIELEAQKLTHAMPTIQPVVVYGGANIKGQLKELADATSSPQNELIVVATPGRLTDFVDRNLVSLEQVQFLVLDEADRYVNNNMCIHIWNC